MIDIFVFDKSEPSNCEAWKKLPSFFQEYITAKHENLRNYVFQLTKNTPYKPLFTSGFRSVRVNKMCGGVQDSLHIFGLAVDFVLVDKFNRIVSASKYKDIFLNFFNVLDNHSDFTLIVERTHFHLQYNRKK